MNLFWEAATPFGLTSLKLLLIVTVLGLTCVAALLWRSHRRTDKPTATARLLDTALYLAGIILPVFAMLLIINRANGFYQSFAELAYQLANLP